MDKRSEIAGGASVPRYLVRLYIEGNGVHSTAAVRLVTSICEERLGSCYRLEVIDLEQMPRLAARDVVLAAPTLVRALPAPSRRKVGRLTRDSILEVLNTE